MTIGVYQIHISLRNIKPKIWRRILVSPDTLLSDFHEIIQINMGWTDSHLHHFIQNETFYTVKMDFDDTWDEMNNVDYKKMKISDLLINKKDKIIYEYDFGDGWIHDIILEKILPTDNITIYPICIDGKMNCPPEDCGGVWGYSEMLEVLKHPGHEEYENYMEWLGEEFDPEYFNKDEVNQILQEEDY